MDRSSNTPSNGFITRNSSHSVIFLTPTSNLSLNLIHQHSLLISLFLPLLFLIIDNQPFKLKNKVEIPDDFQFCRPIKFGVNLLLGTKSCKMLSYKF